MYFVRLGAGSLWDNSEPTYGEIVKELDRTGDWLTLHLNFTPWFVHPPLWFWTAAGAVRFFGLDEFSLRLPSAVFGVLCVWAVYYAARRLYGEIAGLSAALALGTGLEFIVLARLSILDTMLVFFTTVAFFGVYFGARDGDLPAFWTAVVAAALGTLTKGPVAVVLPALVLIAYAGWASDWRRLGRLPWAFAALVYCLLAGSWFGAEALVWGPHFVSDYFGLSNVGRFLTPFENQPGPVYYYVPIVVLGFFPYIAFVPKAISIAWRRRGADEKFLLCCTVVPFLFFSAAATKLPNYAALFFPPLAVLVGAMLGRAIESNDLRSLRGALIVLPASLLLLSVGLIIYGRLNYLGPTLALVPSLELLGWVVVPGAIGTFVVTAALGRAWIAPVGLSAMMAGFVCALVFSVLPRVETFKPMKSMASTVMSMWRPGDQVGITGASGGFSLLFYTGGHGITFIGPLQGNVRPQDFFASRRRVFCIIVPREYDGLKAAGLHLWVLKRAPRMWLVSNQPPTYKSAVR
ncbi:MAG: glycosyltransferase family 39 protein [Candidatus Eremiobacteraeota bacterium]|nr:glycosyltransferase family 39 protein [Candidatus Eremiobacteraeota bacterium]